MLTFQVYQFIHTHTDTNVPAFVHNAKDLPGTDRETTVCNAFFWEEK